MTCADGASGTIKSVSQSTVIVGAGISGLATAYDLQRRGVEVTVLEMSDHPGGKIRTVELLGLAVDTGPDAFLARGADLKRLIDDLGLTSEIVEPQTSGSYIWSRGRLRRLPAGMAFGLPERLWPLLRSGLLSPMGVARAGLDVVLPPTPLPDDPSIADLVRPRFGADVYRRLVEPLLGGVHAGDPARLSARSTAPEVYSLADGHRSVYLSLRRRRAGAPKPSGKPPAPLVSLNGGLGRLVDSLSANLEGRVHTGVGVNGLAPAGDGWRLDTTKGTLTADTVVLAIPAYRAADLLRPASPELADLLAAIPYVDVANATLAYRRQDVPELPAGTGFLVPPVEGEFIVGCTWLTNKWPYLRNDDIVLIKCMVGRDGDSRWLQYSDEQIIERARDGLSRMLGLRAEPLASHVRRWPRAMPQYTVGHGERLDAIDRELATRSGLYLTGAAYRGAGLAACTTQAAATARALTEGDAT